MNKDKYMLRKVGRNVGRKDRRRAKRLLKKCKDRNITTGNGAVIDVLERTGTYLILKARKGNAKVKVTMDRLVECIAAFDIVNIVEREQLEPFNSFSSMMFALLNAIFSRVSRVVKRGNLLQLIKECTRVFLAGIDKDVRETLAMLKTGPDALLSSFHYARNILSENTTLHKLLEGREGKYEREKYVLRILDSGTFSEWRKVQNGSKVENPMSLDQYISFIRQYDYLYDFYFNFDVIGDHKASMLNLRKMEAAGLHPIPVFHMGTPFRELEKLVNEGYPVIGLGGTVFQSGLKLWLDEVFNRFPEQAFHGLGITDAKYLMSYPFFSVDSKAWIGIRKDFVALTEKGQVENREHKAYAQSKFADQGIVKKQLRERQQMSGQFLRSLLDPDWIRQKRRDLAQPRQLSLSMIGS